MRLYIAFCISIPEIDRIWGVLETAAEPIGGPSGDDIKLTPRNACKQRIQAGALVAALGAAAS